jgi:HAD superfamily hydrolase (TIGR01490 family)
VIVPQTYATPQFPFFQGFQGRILSAPKKPDDREEFVGLAIFDLDNTLIGGDSDVLWGQFLSERGYVDAELQAREHARYYQDYLDGTLDIFDFLRFQLRVLSENDLATLHAWRECYLREKISPIVLPKAERLLDQHRMAGDTLLIVTATNRFLTEPIAHLLGVPHLIATEPEFIDGRYSGGVRGTPSYAQGKVVRIHEWLAEHRKDLTSSSFYSDSHNDIPLLREVTRPVAVDPDPILEAEARRQNWPVISLR